MIQRMKTYTHTLRPLYGLALTAMAFTLPHAAQAQSVSNSILNSDPSVTVYSLDGNIGTAPTTAVQRPAPVSYTTPTNYNAQISTQDISAASTNAPEIIETTADEASDSFSLFNPNLWGAEWSGRANIGASLQTGNTEQNAVNADASIKAKWLDEAGDTKHRASAKADFNIENEDDTTTEDNRSLDFAYDYFFDKKWFLNSTLGFEQDDIQDLDLRLTAGFGVGHQAFEGDDLNLQYILGPSILHEEFESGNEEDSLAIHWALDYDQKLWDDTFQVFHNHEILVPSDETDAYIFESKSGIRLPIKNGIVATGEIDFDWDNAPEAGIKEDDTTYAVKLGYEW